MKEYIMTLVGVAIFCGVIEMMSLSEGTIKNHLKLIASLCVLCVAITPLGEVLKIIGDGEINEMINRYDKDELELEYKAVYIENLDKEMDSEISSRMESMLCEEFDVAADDIDVVIFSEASEESVKINKTCVVLYPGAIAKDPHKISRYVSDSLKCECEIIYK